jgi:hypothetical protein
MPGCAARSRGHTLSGVAEPPRQIDYASRADLGLTKTVNPTFAVLRLALSLTLLAAIVFIAAVALIFGGFTWWGAACLGLPCVVAAWLVYVDVRRTF